MSKKGILERLAEGPVIGDGSYCVTLEKRGYVKGGPFTPECVVQYPDAGWCLIRHSWEQELRGERGGAGLG